MARPREKLTLAVLNVANAILQYNAIQTLRAVRWPGNLRTSNESNIGPGNEIQHLGDGAMDTRPHLKWVYRCPELKRPVIK